jgi:uncharacterized protein (DUF3084 family)
MLRLLLVLALLVALGTVAIVELKVRPDVGQLRTDLADTKDQLTKTTAEKNDAVKRGNEAKALADKVSKELSDTKATLETALAESTSQRARADKLATELSTTTKSKNEAQTELAQWKALGVTVDQIVQLKIDARNSADQVAEQKVVITKLNRELDFANTKLAIYERPDEEVQLAAGTRGKVTAVSPAKDFVIIDLGEGKAKERAKLMVRRGDKLVTKVRIVTVQSNQSIANIMPDWSQGDVAVQVGDEVLF